jgi:hypothetical protein
MRRGTQVNIQELLTAIDDLSPEELERLKAHITEREQSTRPMRTQEEWLSVIDQAVDVFWGDSSPEEIQALAAAMSTKQIDPRAWLDDEA